MSKFYIPEIGDTIILTEDWNFTLHCEDRNLSLGAYLGYYKQHNLWVPDSVPRMRKIDYEVEYPSYDDYKRMGYERHQQALREAEHANTEYVKFWEDHKKWCIKCDKVGKEALSVTLKSGTVLSIDRIYIRKGAQEYSSISFFAKGLGTVNVYTGVFNPDRNAKALRFWAKLDDCNNITFKKS